jgi:signal transduction histidine kinase
MKMNTRVQVVLRIGTVLIFTTFFFTGVFFLVDWVCHAFGYFPPLLTEQLLSSLTGVLLFVLMSTLLSRIFSTKIRDGQMKVYGPIISTLDRIAQGDFNVRLDEEMHRQFRAHEPFGTLMKSINTMASGLSELEKMRQEFISNVSHEIQSPLTSIRGFAQALQDDKLSNAERHHYLAIIEAESTRLSRITENLLRLAALESEQLHFEPQPYRLDKQLRELILVCEPQWLAREIEMDPQLDELVVTADADLLSQVWLNLLHNSIKFNIQRGKVAVRLYRQGGSIICSISDTGIGIAAESINHIFERFYKADPARKRSTEGSGLGLAIARRIVELHQGTIDVASKPGAGTTFTVSLPVSPPASPLT